MKRLITKSDKKFAEIILKNRRGKNITQESVACELSVDKTTYNKWETGSLPVPLTRLTKLTDALGIPIDVVDKYISARSRLYFAASYTTLRENNISDYEIFHATDILISEFPAAEIYPPDIGSNDFGEPSKWMQFVRDHPETFRLIGLHGSDQYVAYWHVASISKEIYGRGRLGKNINLEISSEHINNFVSPDNHDLYFIDLFRMAKFNNAAANRTILESFLEFLKDLSEYGHYVNRILAHASTPEAENICIGLGFSFVCDHEDHRRYNDFSSDRKLIPTKIFELDLLRNFKKLMAIDSELLERYSGRRK